MTTKGNSNEIFELESKNKKGSGYEMKTKHGYLLDEVASALQKSIRRGLVYESVYWAYELFQPYWKYVFKRLCVIAVEDIGKANPDLVTQVFLTNAYVQAQKVPPDPVLVSYIVMQMARSPKSREADELINIIQMDMKEGKRLQIPDWAIDKHTKRGKMMGKGVEDFWKEGAKLENEVPSEYKDELYRRLNIM